MKVGSLFSGIGGFDLGLERAGFDIAWQVEINEYCKRVLRKHWPAVRQYGDIRDIEWSTVEPVDLICGGFPCQDISEAGRGAGLSGSRSGLWFEFHRAIDECRPAWVCIENVSALRYRGLDQVLRGLAEIGYDAEWHCIPASAVGAPHRRDRIFIVAHLVSEQSRRRDHGIERRQQGTEVRTCTGRPRDWSANDWWKIEPDVGRVVDGVPARLERLRGLGNAVVPQIAETLGRMILEVEQQP